MRLLPKTFWSWSGVSFRNAEKLDLDPCLYRSKVEADEFQYLPGLHHWSFHRGMKDGTYPSERSIHCRELICQDKDSICTFYQILAQSIQIAFECLFDLIDLREVSCQSQLLLLNCFFGEHSPLHEQECDKTLRMARAFKALQTF